MKRVGGEEEVEVGSTKAEEVVEVVICQAALAVLGDGSVYWGAVQSAVQCSVKAHSREKSRSERQ